HKENQSPWQIIERIAPRSPLELCLLPPVFLEYYLNDAGGYDVPRHPSRVRWEARESTTSAVPKGRIGGHTSRIHEARCAPRNGVWVATM
ncbi:MAG TPA: hypothetical protein VEH50_11635, partial [Methylomirabilota bacterium]|nr:hypothetical protein [Methylomirabilota bacterium]